MALRYLTDDELTHHGVKGQEWGVRNGPPYPLGSAGKKRNRVNAKYKKERSILESKKSTQKQKNKVSAGLGQMGGLNRYFDTVYNGSELKVNPGLKVKLDEIIEAFTSEGLDITDRDVIKPSVLDENGNMKEIGTFANHTTVTSDDLLDVNGFHRLNTGQLLNGYNQNCLKCSAALELRRRGLDVIAGGSVGGGNGATALSYWFNNAVAYKETSSTVEQRLSKFGRRGSAEINFRYPNGAGGHSMYIQNDQSNKPRFYDGQTGKKFNSLNDVYNHYGFDRDARINVTRLDNATPNYKHMAEDNVLEFPGAESSMNVVDKRNGKAYDRW